MLFEKVYILQYPRHKYILKKGDDVQHAQLASREMLKRGRPKHESPKICGKTT